MLTQEQLEHIARTRVEIIRKIQTVPVKGTTVEYFNKKFFVLPTVFWPWEDSRPLLENYIVNQGERVLDVCTGSGHIAVFSAYKGAGRVVALDHNPAAVEAAKKNAALHGFSEIIDVRLSDMLSALDAKEKFDVVTGNLPFTDQQANNLAESAVYDEQLRANRLFFTGINAHLNPHGRIYLSQANFGALDAVRDLAENAGFTMKKIGEKKMNNNDPRVFYAFELKKKKHSI
ncbi:MAG: 50S ribosomal protein L11 methyltransferase [Candidatus Woesearchaeota archaeon]